MSEPSAINEKFPHPTVTPHVGVPTYRALANIHIQLNANAAAVESPLGNGQLGHLFLTIPPTEYLELSDNIPYVKPVRPAVHPAYPANATEKQIMAIDRIHKNDKQLWARLNATDSALSQQLLTAVEPLYYKALPTRRPDTPTSAR